MKKIKTKEVDFHWKDDVSNNLFAYGDNVNCNFNGCLIYIARNNDGDDNNESIAKRIHCNKNFSGRW